MKRLLLVLATGFGLDGCASLTQKADENGFVAQRFKR